jgi:hypothetical protein
MTYIRANATAQTTIIAACHVAGVWLPGDLRGHQCRRKDGTATKATTAPAGHSHISSGCPASVAGNQARSSSAMPSTEPNPSSWTIDVDRARARHTSTPGTVVEASQTPAYRTTDVAGSPTVVRPTTTTPSTSSQPAAVTAPARIPDMCQDASRRRLPRRFAGRISCHDRGPTCATDDMPPTGVCADRCPHVAIRWTRTDPADRSRRAARHVRVGGSR